MKGVGASEARRGDPDEMAEAARVAAREASGDGVSVQDLRVAMLHYGVGTGHVFVSLIDQDGAVTPLRLAAVERVAASVERLSRMLRAPTRFPPSELTASLHDFSIGWGRLLLPDPELLAGYDVLILIPHHFLHDLPFQLVAVGDADDRLGNRFALSSCSSATLFGRAVTRNPARRPDADLHAPRVCRYLGVDIIGGDPRYAELARACGERFPESHAIGGRDAVKRPVVRDADVVCLVCHGVTDPHDHDDSGLLLTCRPGFRSELTVPLHLGREFFFRDLPFRYIPPQVELTPEFGANPMVPELMTIAEVRTLVESRAQLVMLLGCSTATGQLRSGDSYASLALQWLQAGAVSVLGHQWEADFPFVQAWVPVFLDHWLHRRRPKAVAVRDSLNQVLADGLVPRNALAVWGAVILMGDWL